MNVFEVELSVLIIQELVRAEVIKYTLILLSSRKHKIGLNYKFGYYILCK
jgi:hypothetical protein